MSLAAAQAPAAKPANEPEPAGPPLPVYPGGYPALFVAWHEAHPEVYTALVQGARRLVREKITAISLRYLYEHERIQRWKRARRAKKAAKDDTASAMQQFGLNNNFVTWYGRLIVAQEKDLQDCFSLRATQNGTAKAEAAGQVPLEFD